MFTHALAAIDPAHPERAAELVPAARHLVGPEGRVLLAAVVELPPPYVAVQLPAQVSADARRRTADALATYEDERTAVVIEEGHAPSMVLEIAESRGVDLIVVASHRPGLQDYFIGSTAGRIVRHARCPVLVLR